MKALIGLLLLVSGHGVSSVIHSLKYFYTASSGVSIFPEFVAVGMVDEVQVSYYDSNIQRIVFKQAWMDRLARDHPDELERSTGITLGHQHVYKVMLETLKKRFNQTGGAHIYQNMYGCEWDEEDGTTDGYNQFGYDGEDFIALDLKTLTWIAPVPQAVTSKQKFDQERASNHYLKNYLTKECVDWLKKYLAYGKSTLQRTEVPRVSLLQRGPSSPVVCHATGFYPDSVVVFWRRDGQELHEHVDHGEVLPNHDGTFQVSVDLDLASVPQEDWGRYECVVQLKGIEDISIKLDPACIRTNGVIHSLKYFHTASSGISTFPEFVAVGMVDEVQIDYYDSNIQRVVLKQAWMDQVTRDHPDYLDRETGKARCAQGKYKVLIETLKNVFHQTRGAHIVQRMFGCEWDEEDGTTDGYDQYGYDGEDFISFDLKTMTWMASVHQAFPTKLQWDRSRTSNEQQKMYFTKVCVDWLKKFLAYGKSTLQRTEVPRVSLLQRGPSSPVVCHATGFYPDRVVVFWRRDGQELHEHVDQGEVLPNHDGTFQVSVDLDLASVPQEDWGRYECVVQLKGIEDISTPLDPALIRTNGVIHSLKYFYTASSGVSTFPEFVVVGMVDEVQAGYYDSNIQRIVFKQAWVDQLARDDPDELEWNIEKAWHHQQEYKDMLHMLKRRFNQTGGAHIFQNMYGCEWDDEDGTTDGYNQFGYDGEDFVAFDLKTLTWIAPVPQAVTTKQRWDQDRAQNQYLKNYLTKECVDWLKKYLAYGKSTLQRTEVPRVSLLQRGPSSPVVCHATGFYPDRVVVFWRRDGQELHEHVDQGEVLPNHDGTFQVSLDLDLASVPQEDWGRYECVVQLKGIEDISTKLDPALIRTNWGKTGLGGDGVIHSLKYFYTASSGVSTFPEFVAVGMVDEVQIGYYDSNIQIAVLKQAWVDQVARDDPDELERDIGKARVHQQEYKAMIETLKNLFNQTGGAHIVQTMYGCEWDEEDGTTDGYNQYGYDGEDFIALDLKTMTWIAPVRQAVTTKQRWDQNRAHNQYLKYYFTKECVYRLKKYLAYGNSPLQRTGRVT
ncbi:unnamed protein product [Lota lota]